MRYQFAGVGLLSQPQRRSDAWVDGEDAAPRAARSISLLIRTLYTARIALTIHSCADLRPAHRPQRPLRSIADISQRV